MKQEISINSGSEKIIVSLDVPTKAEAIKLVKLIDGNAAMFKVGLELLFHEGITVIKDLIGQGAKIFLDAKFHDIPNTVAGAAKGAVRLGVHMFNVHASGGHDMMRAAVDAAKDEAARLNIHRPIILGVTILTSIDKSTMNHQLRIPGTVERQVVNLAIMAEKAGLDGIIASPREIVKLRKYLSKNMLIVTPGIRPIWAASQDQRRIMTPGEAIRNGASYIVVGRPIIKPPSEIGSPLDAAIKIAEEIAENLRGE